MSIRLSEDEAWEVLRTAHTGIFNAVFGDGSVHFMGASINLNIAAALFTRAGGEVISTDWY